MNSTYTLNDVVFHEFFVREHDRTDNRLARAILKYRPDMLFFETGSKNGNPDMPMNRQSPDHKSRDKVREIQEGYRIAGEQFGYAKSNFMIWENIMKLWDEGHNVLVFNADAPNEIRQEWFEVWNHMYPCEVLNWLWWVRIYLRERYMARNIQWALAKYPSKKKRVALVQFGGFHWRHVKFLLTNPSDEQIWDYYFKKFEKEVVPGIIEDKIKKNNKLFHRYWKKLGGLKI